MSDYAALLPRLSEIARKAGAIALEARNTPERSLKSDGSILTNGDRQVEEFLRKELVALVPGSTVWGEEFGFSEEGEGGLWLVDPVDGTSNYSFGSPLWGVSIGLLRGANLELGSVILPDLGEHYLSARGHGVTMNGEALPSIPTGQIKPFELVSFGDRVLRTYGCGEESAQSPLPGKMRHAGAFVIDGCFVATQRYRGLIGIRERLYDIAACVLFAQELGADVRYADGSPFDLTELKQNKKIDRAWIVFPAESGFLLDRP